MNEPIITAPAETPVSEAKEKFSLKKFFSSPKVRLISILCSILIVVGVALAVTLTVTSPEYRAKQMAMAYMYDDITRMNKYTAYDMYSRVLNNINKTEEEYFASKGAYYREDIDSWEYLSKVERERRDDDYFEAYGDYKICIEVTRVKDTSKGKLDQTLITRLESNGLFDRDDIEDVKQVSLTIKIQGENKIKRIKATVDMVKIGLLWQVFDWEYEY